MMRPPRHRSVARWPAAFLAACLVARAAGGATPPPTGAPEPTYLSLGVLVTELGQFDPKTHSFRIGLYIWHVGPRDGPNHLDRLQLRNAAEIIAVERSRLDRGDVTVHRQYLQARVTHEWDLTRFPFDDQTLVIRFDATDADYDELRFAGDSSTPVIDVGLVVPGWTVTGGASYATRQVYSSAMGDPSPAAPGERLVPEAQVTITVARSALSGFWKMLATALAAAGLALTAYFIPLNIGSALSPRFGLIAGSVFADVISMRQTANDLGAMDAITLADELHIAVLLYIATATVVSLYTHWHHQRYADAAFIRRVDLRAAALSTLVLASAITLLLNGA